MGVHPVGSSYLPGSPIPSGESEPLKELRVESSGLPVPRPNYEVVPPLPPLNELPVPRPKAQPAEQDAGPAVSTDASAKQPEDVPLIPALRCFIGKRPADAVNWLKQYSKADQELLLCLLPVIVRLAEGDWRTDPHETHVVVDRLTQTADKLRPLASLSIDNMCFCRRIDSFGRYDVLPSEYGFRPGEMVHVYVELQNFLSEQRDNSYRIRLSSYVEIRDMNNRLLWDYAFRENPIFSLSKRHDYFNKYEFPIPPHLTPGPYTLSLKVTDLATGRDAKRTLDFRVIPGTSP
jgi:hypothetical protein